MASGWCWWLRQPSLAECRHTYGGEQWFMSEKGRHMCLQFHVLFTTILHCSYHFTYFIDEGSVAKRDGVAFPKPHVYLTLEHPAAWVHLKEDKSHYAICRLEIFQRFYITLTVKSKLLPIACKPSDLSKQARHWWCRNADINFLLEANPGNIISGKKMWCLG